MACKEVGRLFAVSPAYIDGVIWDLRATYSPCRCLKDHVCTTALAQHFYLLLRVYCLTITINKIRDKKNRPGTLRRTNTSHLGKRKIIDSKVPAGTGDVSSQEGNTGEFCRDFVLMRVLQHFIT